MNAFNPPLRSQLLPTRASRATTLTADALLIATGVLLIALSAQISVHIPGTPVPGTLQTGAVLLVGASLGTVRGVLSVALYLLAGTTLPVFAGGTSGWDTFSWGTTASRSGGFLVGMLIATVIVGALADRGWDRRVRSALAMMAIGDAVVFAIGVPWLHQAVVSVVPSYSWWDATNDGFLKFIVIEAMKFCIVAGLLPVAWAVVRRVRGADTA